MIYIKRLLIGNVWLSYIVFMGYGIFLFMDDGNWLRLIPCLPLILSAGYIVGYDIFPNQRKYVKKKKTK